MVSICLRRQSGDVAPGPLPEARVVGALGVALVLSAAFCNEWILAALFSDDGDLHPANLLLIRLFDAAAILLGLATVCFRRRLKIRGLITSALSVIALTIAAEAALNWAFHGRAAASPAPPALLRENPLGTGSYRLRENLRVTYAYGTHLTDIRTNAYGMRWRPVEIAKPPGVRRIAFVGDSFTFGESADSIETSFVGIFESSVGPAYEVLNFGVIGYGISDIRLQLEETVLSFAPDYVILVTFNGNDFRDTYLGMDRFDVTDGTLRWNDAVLAERIPTAYRDAPPAVEAPRASLLWRSQLYRLFVSATQRHDGRDTSAKPAIATRPFVGSDQFTSFSFWSRIPYPPVAERAAAMSRDELDRIRSLCEANRVTLMVAAVPYEEQVLAETLSGTDHDGRAFDVRLPQAYVERWAGENSVDYLDLLPTLRRAARAPQVLYAGGTDMHLNTVGHHLVGDALAEFFAEVAAAGPLAHNVKLPQPQTP